MFDHVHRCDSRIRDASQTANVGSQTAEHQCTSECSTSAHLRLQYIVSSQTAVHQCILGRDSTVSHLKLQYISASQTAVHRWSPQQLYVSRAGGRACSLQCQQKGTVRQCPCGCSPCAALLCCSYASWLLIRMLFAPSCCRHLRQLPRSEPKPMLPHQLTLLRQHHSITPACFRFIDCCLYPLTAHRCVALDIRWEWSAAVRRLC